MPEHPCSRCPAPRHDYLWSIDGEPLCRLCYDDDTEKMADDLDSKIQEAQRNRR